MSTKDTKFWVIIVVAAILGVFGLAILLQDPLPQGSEEVSPDPSDFSTNITHPYWPMKPSTQWIFKETEPGEPDATVVMTVTNQTKTLKSGVKVRVVRDTSFFDGELEEDTFDYFAQHKDGTLWYFGEDSGYYEHGKFKEDAGSFEHGVDGAQAGVALPADPKVGQKFRLEYYKAQAEDQIEILDINTFAQVEAGKYHKVLMTKDTSPIEPNVLEHKFYAYGVGPILSLHISDGAGREELVRVKKVSPFKYTSPLGSPEPLG